MVKIIFKIREFQKENEYKLCYHIIRLPIKNVKCVQGKGYRTLGQKRITNILGEEGKEI